MSELVLLKLGGSVITDKNSPFTAREEVIRRLGREIWQALDDRHDLQLILGHGSGSFGHVVAQEYRTQEGALREDSWYGYAETAAAAARLNRLVTDLLFEEGVPVVSYQPSASARCSKGGLMYLDMHPMTQVLEAGLVPLVYGDVAVDAIQGFTIISTEQIFDYIARELPRAGTVQPARIILAGVVDGVYAADPLTHPDASRYEEITLDNWPEVEAALGGSHGTDVTGGMFSKVRDMYHLMLAQPPLQIHIISAAISGHVASALADSDSDIGTLIC